MAGVEICDGGAVKRLAVIVSPDARLALAESARLKGGAVLKPADGDSVQPRVRLSSAEDTATFGYPELPAGRYCVFALARFAGQPEDESCCVHIVNPDPAGKKEEKSFPVARYINGATDYLKVHVGRKGGRSRWKWDTANLTGREYGQTDFFAWSIRPVTFPRSGRVELELSGVSAEGVEVAAVLILPEPDLECRNDLRKTLFGMNCDPFLVR